MTAKIKYSDEPMGGVRVVMDFFPSPEELTLKDETVKITISLCKTNVDFFKREAKKHNTKYQKMTDGCWMNTRIINSTGPQKRKADN